MSFLRDMIDRAKGVLGSKPEPKRTDAIRHDRFDQVIYRELLEEAPALREMVEDLNQKYDYTEDLVRDVLMEFWQGDPRMREATEMRPGWLQNHAVSGHIQASPHTEEARAYTVHDRYSAAMATLGVADEVRQALERYREEQQAAKEAAEQAAEAEQDADTAMQCLEHALGEAEKADSPDDQAAAQMMLAEALEMVQAAQDAADQTGADAADAQQAAAQLLRTPVQNAVKQAGEELAEQAALFTAWGVDDGVLHRLDFKQRADLASRLQHNRLGEFARLIGRFKMMAVAQQARKVEYGRDQVVGVELSGDLTRLIATEYAYLGVPELELHWMLRFVQKRLLSRKYVGTEQVGKGAIIAAIDCSGSMREADQGGIPREAWAKALALALLDQARRTKRDFVAVLFSSARQQYTIEFPRGEGSIEKVLELAEMFYGGGTDFMAPMDLCVDKLEREYNDAGKQKGDIVFITDDDCGVTPEWMHRYHERKHKLGFRTFGIQVGGSMGYGDALAAMSDNVRAVSEFADPDSVSDIFRLV